MDTMPNRILNIGSLNLDQTYFVSHIVQGGETLPVKTLQSFCGGKGLNQSLAAARMGASVCHGGAVGIDGDPLLNVLQKSDVDCTRVLRRSGGSGHAIIQVNDGGENAILVFGGANHSLTEAELDEMLAGFGKGDLLLLQNECNGVSYAMRKAKAQGMTVLFNPAPMTDDVREMALSEVDWLVVNETEAAALAGDWDALRARFPNQKCIMTQGKRGSMCFDGAETIQTPAFLVRTIDTTGAGDTFLGCFAAKVALGAPARVALRYATAASALAVGVAGAAASIPNAKAVEAFLKQID